MNLYYLSRLPQFSSYTTQTKMFIESDVQNQEEVSASEKLNEAEEDESRCFFFFAVLINMQFCFAKLLIHCSLHNSKDQTENLMCKIPFVKD